MAGSSRLNLHSRASGERSSLVRCKRPASRVMRWTASIRAVAQEFETATWALIRFEILLRESAICDRAPSTAEVGAWAVKRTFFEVWLNFWQRQVSSRCVAFGRLLLR